MSAEGLLARILDSKRAEIDHARGMVRAPRSRATRDVLAALRRPDGAPLRLITEVKMKSPSAGVLSSVLDAPSRARVYAKGGAAMISVLCDQPFFGGSWQDLDRARARLDEEKLGVPLLAKEFVLDEVQLDLAAAHGADAILLIARLVEPEVLAVLAKASRARGLEPLVEVVDEPELESALAAGARIIGVNARDLDTLVLDAARAARVLEAVPRDIVAVHLSGLREPAAVSRVAAGRSDAALIGEALMREDDPALLLSAMVRAAAP